MSNYHNRIMNIQSNVEDQDYEHRIIYKTGHRDARHEAAEIVIEAEKEIEGLKYEVKYLQSLLDYANKHLDIPVNY